MRCFRIELARYLEDGTTDHQVRFEADDLAADAVYRELRDSQPGDGERTRGVFIDVLEVNSDEDLVTALRDPQGSRYEHEGLTSVARSAGAF